MKLEQIEIVASHQKNEWEELDGKIEGYDVRTNRLVVGDKTFSVNENCRKQIIERLHLLGSVKDFAEDISFFQECVNHKIEFMGNAKRFAPARVIFDIATNEAKALKTTYYKRVHNYDILKMAEEKCGYDINEGFSYIDDDMMVLFYSDMKKAEAKVGDVVGLGVRVFNSESGVCGLGADQTLYRLFCSNGGIMPMTALQQKLKHVYSDIQQRFHALLGQVFMPDMVMAKIKIAMGRKPIVESREELPQALALYKVPLIHHEGIVKAFDEEPIIVEGGVNHWGVYSAITRYASNRFSGSQAERQALLLSAFQFLR